MKTCQRCKIEKALSEFSSSKKTRDGYNNWCKLCVHEYNQEYYASNGDRIKKSAAAYSSNNKEKIKKGKREYAQRNRERLLKYKKQYYRRNKEKMLAQAKEYRKTHRSKINAHIRDYIELNPDYKLAKNMRGRINNSLDKTPKIFTLKEVLGCSLEFFRTYLESQFTDGMNWTNHTRNGWHADHIIPISAFDLSNPIHYKACFHYSNYQPLWGLENLSKHNNYTQEDFNRHLAKFL